MKIRHTFLKTRFAVGKERLSSLLFLQSFVACGATSRQTLRFRIENSSLNGDLVIRSSSFFFSSSCCVVAYRIPRPPSIILSNQNPQKAANNGKQAKQTQKSKCGLLLPGTVALDRQLLIISTIINFLKQSLLFLQKNFMEGFPLYIII